MSGRDMAWRSLGGLMTLGAVAATLTGPSESLLALFWFFVALGGVVLMLNGKHLVQAVRASGAGIRTRPRPSMPRASAGRGGHEPRHGLCPARRHAPCRGCRPDPDRARRRHTDLCLFGERLRAAASRFREALSPIPRKSLAFAVKANPSLAVLSVLRDEGFGADIVSGGELTAALAAGIGAGDIVYSGVGKTPEELARALRAGVGHINLEGSAKARRWRRPPSAWAGRDRAAAGQSRCRCGHPCQDHDRNRRQQFGVPMADAIGIYDRLAGRPGLTLHGVAVHIGSQIMDLAPLEAAYRRIGELVAALRARGHVVTHVDLGGGLGVDYQGGSDGDVMAYAAMVARVTHEWDVTLMFEPGRYIAAHAGVLLTRVLWVKPGEECPFVVIDAGMNDLTRPALYDAWHEFAAVAPNGATMRAHVVGPVCESSDRFAKCRLVDRVKEGDLTVLRDVGAYGASMASCYNSRALAAEVMVEGDRFVVIAPRIDAAAIRPQGVPDWMGASASSCGMRRQAGRDKPRLVRSNAHFSQSWWTRPRNDATGSRFRVEG